MPFDTHIFIYPLGTEKQGIPQKNDVNSLYEQASFPSGGIGSSHMVPGLWNRGCDIYFFILEKPCFITMAALFEGALS